MKLSSVFKSMFALIMLIFLFLVFAAFNDVTVASLIQEIQLKELREQVASVFRGLGVALAIQPILSICLIGAFIRFGKGADTILRNLIYLYVFVNIGICFLIFAYSAILPWSIPIAS
ncbi:MAG: hypothetical protein PHU06_13160 [Gallionella sp.]|nr:hypothetical protein [Gallionella sp.]MDD4959634.1 hypothetical protein [Gallionella sp.]